MYDANHTRKLTLSVSNETGPSGIEHIARRPPPRANNAHYRPS